MKNKQQEGNKKLIKQLYSKLNLCWQEKRKMEQNNPILRKPPQQLISKVFAKRFESEKKYNFSIYTQHEYRKKIVDAIKARTNPQKQRSNKCENRYKKIQSGSLFQVSNSANFMVKQGMFKKYKKICIKKNKQCCQMQIRQTVKPKHLYRSNSSLNQKLNQKNLFKSLVHSKQSLKSTQIVCHKNNEQQNDKVELKGWHYENNDNYNQQMFENIRAHTQD